MKFNKENIKAEVIKALKGLLEGSIKYRYSCNAVEYHLEKVFKGIIIYAEYELTQEVLSTSEDAHLYDRHTKVNLINVGNPFVQPNDPEHTEEECLRKRFVELSIKNLESGVFDIEIEAETDVDGDVELIVTLILHSDYKGK